MITLVWTLLRQGPAGKAACRKVIVVTPVGAVGDILLFLHGQRACLRCGDLKPGFSELFLVSE